MNKCYICNGLLISIGTVPFGRNIGTLPCTDFTPVEYYRCTNCDFICCPEMLDWPSNKFSELIYNEDYILLDPGYNGLRASNTKDSLDILFQYARKKPNHLDYGSGRGFLTDLLLKDKWNSTSYDPFTSKIRPTSKYKLITAIEVVEHSTNMFQTMDDMLSLLERQGVILITTKLCTKETLVDWWYICARSGHIGIHSEKSMIYIAKKYNLFFTSINEDFHYFQSTRNNFKQLLRGAL
jgi:hypothetical protein